jgi:hypothetical protein
MKQASKMFIGIAMILTAFLLISLITSNPVSFAARSKDRNCTNRCLADEKACFQRAKKNTYKDRITAENDCRRQMDICVGLCPDAGL